MERSAATGLIKAKSTNTPAMSKAAKNPRPFRSRVNFLPRIFISNGAVTIPTMTKVVIKVEMVITVAPERSRDPANGKATSLPMVSGVKTPKVRPTMPSTASRLGAVFRSAFPATLKAIFVFSLLLIREATKQTAEIL